MLPHLKPGVAAKVTMKVPCIVIVTQASLSTIPPVRGGFGRMNLISKLAGTQKVLSKRYFLMHLQSSNQQYLLLAHI